MPSTITWAASAGSTPASRGTRTARRPWRRAARANAAAASRSAAASTPEASPMPTATRTDPSSAIRWVWPAPPSNPTDARPAAPAPSASAPAPEASTRIATASAPPGTSSTTAISTARIRPIEGTGSNPSGTATARRCGTSRSATIDTADLPGVRALGPVQEARRRQGAAARRSASSQTIRPLHAKVWNACPTCRHECAVGGRLGLAQPHPAADVVHRRGRLRGEPVGAVLENRVELGGPGHEVQVALPGRRVVGDDPLGQQPLRVDTARPCRPLAVPDLFVVEAEEPVELADVADLRPAGLGPQDPLRVGDHRHDLFPDHVGLGEDLDRVPDRLAHLPDAVRAEDRRRLGEDGLRLDERFAVTAVERPHDLAAQLEVGGLVLADRDAVGAVDDDVGGLQDRVGEQRVVDVVGLLLLLLLVGRRPLDPADRRDGREQPGQLRVLGAVALDEERALRRVE